MIDQKYNVATQNQSSLGVIDESNCRASDMNVSQRWAPHKCDRILETEERASSEWRETINNLNVDIHEEKP